MIWPRMLVYGLHLSELDWKDAGNEHVLCFHVPYNASCEECHRARSLQPARLALTRSFRSSVPQSVVTKPTAE